MLVRSVRSTQRTSLEHTVAERIGSELGSTPMTIEQMTAHGVIDAIAPVETSKVGWDVAPLAHSTRR